MYYLISTNFIYNQDGFTITIIKQKSQVSFLLKILQKLSMESQQPLDFRRSNNIYFTENYESKQYKNSLNCCTQYGELEIIYQEQLSR